MSPTSSAPSNTRSRPVSVTTPIAVALVSQRLQTASSASRRAGSITHSIRSWDSEIITSNGSMPGSRLGTFATSRSRPTPPFEAISLVLDASPAAPRSWSETIRSRSTSSRQHSINLFSSSGSPIWTLGRFAWSPSPSSAEASTLAPPMPSRPVRAPSSTTRFPMPRAAERISRSLRASPTHIAFTRQFCS
jgi:hypothetical protein